VRHGTSAPLFIYALAVILLTIGKGWGGYLTHQRIAGIGQRVAYDLRNQILSHLQSLPPAFFDRANTGDLMARATSDVEGVRMFIAWSLSTFLEMICLFTASLVLMSLMSWRLTLLSCVLFPILGYTVMRFRQRIRPRYLAVQEQYGHMATVLQENLAGIRLIQAYRREQTESPRFRELNEELFRCSMAAAERVFHLLDQRAEIHDIPHPMAQPSFREAVEFRHVSFAYARGDQVLHEVSFSLRKGERLALIGPTGAGKTSIVSLLCRFYEPEYGLILCDGVDIRQLSLADLRRKLGLVLQEPFLFSASLQHNLTLGNARITRATLLRAARMIGTERLIQNLPQGLDTPIFERGANLSLGEKQLLSLTRALAHNPDILLLDEATSSVDAEAEALIQAGIKQLLAHRTALVIAHRLSTIREMDRILVLDHGRLIEEGTHAQLLAAGGLYAKMYGLQFAADAMCEAAAPHSQESLGGPPSHLPLRAPASGPLR
jgi:ABC-type multidrug transport system fused ATPase/permease subunit